MHIISARIQVKPECREQFIEASRAIISGTRAEQGCMFYALHEDVHEPQSFLFYEEWEDQAAIDNHFQEPHFQAFGEAIVDLIVCEPDIAVMAVDPQGCK
jgi:quinol monooxygenase YgiN